MFFGILIYGHCDFASGVVKDNWHLNRTVCGMFQGFLI